MNIIITGVERLLAIGLALLGSAAPLPVCADVATDWNQNMFTSVSTAKLGPLATSHVSALVQSAVFDAVNGVRRHYTPIYVPPAAAPGTSAEAAAAQAAHDILTRLFPEQQTALDAQLAVSLTGLLDAPTEPLSPPIQRGIAWGQYVAGQIWNWRSNDGFNAVAAPFYGGLSPGEWRPTLPTMAPGSNPQVAYSATWVIESQDQFRPDAPPDLTSPEYTQDFNEIKRICRFDSSARSDDQTQLATFWYGNTIALWNRTALQVAAPADLSLLENSRLLALLNLAMADASVCAWDAKYHYAFWRPITAIQLADTDGNPDTAADAAWTPLLPTPPFPEYPSNHTCTSGAAATVLATFFGDETPFWATSETLPAATRYFPGFSQATDEVNDARVYVGIHFRNSCEVGRAMGQEVAAFVLGSALRPAHGDGR